MYLLGYDLGSSSVKASIVDSKTGECIASAFKPEREMLISAPHAGWAEQTPATWWQYLVQVTGAVLAKAAIPADQIAAIGISYQMHGLVVVDDSHKSIRPSIIWCDSRAVETGNEALSSLGNDRCLTHLLNSPGNFTASKLRWVQQNQPDVYERIHKMMLPGDYLAMKMTGAITTTLSGLSEGIFWDFQEEEVADFLLDHYQIDASLIPDIVPTFGDQGKLQADVATELGLKPGTPITYRAGDQPNNAFSLNVLNPGEVAATAGTSGVVYGVSDQAKFDPKSRVNTFAHVNHSPAAKRLGVLLCVNGTGILYNWLRRNVSQATISYEDMNNMAGDIEIGSEGLCVLPFGNGAERMLENRETGAQISYLDLNRHNDGHLIRAAQEGIAFAFHYGMNIMKEMEIQPKIIRAGDANLFLSPVFRDMLAGISGIQIELYNTDGSIGAALGAGIGAGTYASPEEAFNKLECLEVTDPNVAKASKYQEAYERWNETLTHLLRE